MLLSISACIISLNLRTRSLSVHQLASQLVIFLLEFATPSKEYLDTEEYSTFRRAFQDYMMLSFLFPRFELTSEASWLYP
jgi:hypothetical protein